MGNRHLRGGKWGEMGKELGKNGERMWKTYFGQNPHFGGKLAKIWEMGETKSAENCNSHDIGGELWEIVDNLERIGKHRVMENNGDYYY